MCEYNAMIWFFWNFLHIHNCTLSACVSLWRKLSGAIVYDNTRNMLKNTCHFLHLYQRWLLEEAIIWDVLLLWTCPCIYHTTLLSFTHSTFYVKQGDSCEWSDSLYIVKDICLAERHTRWNTEIGLMETEYKYRCLFNYHWRPLVLRFEWINCILNRFIWDEDWWWEL